VWIGGIEYGDEDVDHPHRIVFSHVIVEELGEQNALRSVFAPNKSASSRTPTSRRQDSNSTNVFTQARRETGKE
jgi:hypothetical protein